MRKFTLFLLICLALSTLASCSEGGNNITLENFELYKSDLDSLVNLFKSSIPSEIREEKKVFFCLGREDESISIAIDGYTNGKRNIRGGYSIKKGGKEYKEALAYLGRTEAKVDSIQSLLKESKMHNDKYWNIQIFRRRALQFLRLRLQALFVFLPACKTECQLRYNRYKTNFDFSLWRSIHNSIRQG